MIITGLIVEYNPFHNGHLYHLEESRKISGADGIICVMSGNFMQRGEPAIINKQARAKAALLNGADLVLELPSVYAMSSAEYFAYGSVRILESTGVTNYICFGSESGSMDDLTVPAEVFAEEPELYKEMLRAELNKGASYPEARENALNVYMKETAGEKKDIPVLMKQSNNILGIEYVKALKRLKSKIIPLTIKRLGSEYNSEVLEGRLSSATSIRKAIINAYKGDFNDCGDWSDCAKKQLFKDLPADCIQAAGAMPVSVHLLMEEEFKYGRGPVSLHDFEAILLSSVRRMTLEDLRELPFITEGLENRIKKASDSSGSIDMLLDLICTKRYTRTRIQRILCSILTSATGKDTENFQKCGGPQYIRVLGFNHKGREILSRMKKNATLPVITKTADFRKSCNPVAGRMLEIEAFATDNYVLAYKNPAFRKPGQEFTQNPIIFE